MKGLILAAFAVVALVVLGPSVQACHTGDGSVVGGTTFSIVQQPVLAQQYVQADVGCVQQQAVFAQQAYAQPLVQSVVSSYAQPIIVRRSVFRDRVFVPHHHALNLRVGY